MKRVHALLFTIVVTSVAFVATGIAPQSASARTPCVRTDKNGPNSNCGPYYSRRITLSNGYNTYVGNNGWACGSDGSDCGPQRLIAYGPSRWRVVSNQQAGNTAVLTYPNVQQLFTTVQGASRRLSSFSAIRSHYRELMPHNRRTIAQAAYDIWLDHTSGPNEVMIWVDNVNRGTGGSRVLRHHTFSGVRWALMQYGGPGGELIWSRRRNAHASTVHILPMLRWLVHHGFESRTTSIGQVDFGWEICSTGGGRETFRVTGYRLMTRHA